MYRLADDTRTDLDATDHFDRAPTENLLFVTAGEQGSHRLREGRWGLVPWKAKEVPKQVMSNARVEVADISSAFKDAWGSKRCLVPADGFYVNGRDGDSWFVHQSGGRPFSFAGLWAYNSRLGITSCTLVTMPATEPVDQLHRTQPAILAPEAYDAWLNPATPAKEVKALFDSCLIGDLEFHRVNQALDPIEEPRNIVVDEQAAPSIREIRRDDGKDRLISRLQGLPSEGPNEILIDPRDRLLARRSGIFKFWCEHEGCNNGAFWGYSQNGQGPRSWFCNEHRADGEAVLGRQRSKDISTPSHVR